MTKTNMDTGAVATVDRSPEDIVNWKVRNSYSLYLIIDPCERQTNTTKAILLMLISSSLNDAIDEKSIHVAWALGIFLSDRS